MITIFGGFAFLASGILANKLILKALPPILFVGIRMLMAGLIIFIGNWNGFAKRGWNRIWEDIIPLAFIALFTTFIPSFFKAFALQNMPAGKTMLIYSIDPFITALYVYILWSEKLTWRKVSGMVIGMIGILVLISSHTPLEEAMHAWGMFSWPELAALSAVFLSRAGWLVIQKFVRSERYTPLEINGIAMLTSGVSSLITAVATHQVYMLPGANVAYTASAMLYTVIGGNIFGYTLYTYALKHYSATLVSLSGFSIPVFVAIGAYFFFGEPLTMYTIGAGAIMFAAIAIFHSGKK